jgi:hypothetical protein
LWRSTGSTSSCCRGGEGGNGGVGRGGLGLNVANINAFGDQFNGGTGGAEHS